MPRKAQHTIVNYNKEDHEATNASDGMKEHWQVAVKHAQAAYEKVILSARRLVEINQSISQGSNGDLRSLIQEKQALELDLEVLPFEAGHALYQAVIARLKYLKAEDQRIQEWERRVMEDDEQNSDKSEEESESIEAFITTQNAILQAKKELQQVIAEARLTSGYWRFEDWRNEDLWEAYANQLQTSRIKVATNARNHVLQGTYGVVKDPHLEACTYRE